MSEYNHSMSHRYYLKQPFYPAIPLDDFTEAEKTILEKHGAWMQALDEGEIIWETEAQRQFLAVLGDFAEPETPHEKVWVKYKTKLGDQQ
jgi:uncharacterized protein YifE (UPF0438 family)